MKYEGAYYVVKLHIKLEIAPTGKNNTFRQKMMTWIAMMMTSTLSLLLLLLLRILFVSKYTCHIFYDACFNVIKSHVQLNNQHKKMGFFLVIPCMCNFLQQWSQQKQLPRKMRPRRRRIKSNVLDISERLPILFFSYSFICLSFLLHPGPLCSPSLALAQLPLSPQFQSVVLFF